MKRKTTQLRPDGLRGTLRALVGGALIAGAALAAPAQAGVITFEGGAGSTAHGDAVTQAGYEIGFFSNAVGATSDDAVGAFIDGSDAGSCVAGSCPVNDPGTYYAALNDSYLDIVSLDGGLFSVKSFDAGFIGSYPSGTSYPTIPGLVRIQGFFADGTSTYETYQLSGPSNNNFYFDHFAPSAAFSALQFAEVAIFGFACGNDGNCQAFSTNRAQFGIDNIELAAAPAAGEVPEPGSALLVGLGLAGLAARVRRRKA